MRRCVYLGVALSTMFYWAVSIFPSVVARSGSGETLAQHRFTQHYNESNLKFKVDIVVAVVGLLGDIWLFVFPLVWSQYTT